MADAKSMTPAVFEAGVAMRDDTNRLSTTDPRAVSCSPLPDLNDDISNLNSMSPSFSGGDRDTCLPTAPETAPALKPTPGVAPLRLK